MLGHVWQITSAKFSPLGHRLPKVHPAKCVPSAHSREPGNRWIANRKFRREGNEIHLELGRPQPLGSHGGEDLAQGWEGVTALEFGVFGPG